MSSNEARQIVEDGLEKKKLERAQRDAALEDQARQLRLTISGNHAEKTMSEIQRKAREEAEARERRAERVRAKAARVYRDMKVEQIVRSYGVLCLLILLLTAVTRMNILVSIALVLGMAVFPTVDIYRLYFPAEEVKK
jgi:Flp pilus assembly protein TadB